MLVTVVPERKDLFQGPTRGLKLPGYPRIPLETPPLEASIPSPPSRDEILGHLRERMVAFAASRYAREAAEDLAQEVLVVLHEKYRHVEALEDLMPLCFQILRFKLAAWQRKVVRRGEHLQVDVEEHPLAGDGPGPEELALRRERMEKLAMGLALLGKRCQEIFRLKLQGKAFAEIQRALGAETLNTVYTWDHRCRKQLLEWMGGSWA